jgi:signal transduction histidine kinase
MTNPSQVVHSLLHELNTPLTVLVSAGTILKNKVPGPLVGSIERLDEVSHQLSQEAVALRANLDEKIDLNSPTTAATQLRELAASWQQYTVSLSDALDQIQATEVQLKDPLLDKILNQSLVSGLDKLKNIMHRLETIQPQDLMKDEG